ncbi:hypothetical protein C9374_011027 [Naegleria lovaniensis]|uniref:Uncharacterized protein n=2 Tax=Naegleria lovaniensis TaxID=51637 RepID=A0AA88GA43_NAELO|nr:uncharacterized protein C9374_011027 [Naegleria lovaniensis]KAG2374190.1 hypothetical protein C9374_011027 [Naegleria lovaniensis]
MAQTPAAVNYSLFPRLISSHPNFLTPCEGLVAPTNYVCYGVKYVQQHVLEPIGEPVYPFFKPIYDVLDEKGGAIGLKPDQTIFVLMMMFTYVFSFIYRMLFNHRAMKEATFLKTLYLVAVGLFYAIFTFGYEGFHAIACSFISYLCMMVLPKSISSKVVFVFVWTYLSMAHFIRMQLDFTSQRVDYSAMLMMMVLRISSCSFNFTDGQNPNAKEELDESLVESSISKVPSFLEYIAFCFYFPALLAGPPFDFKYFQQYLRHYDMDTIPFHGRGLIYNTVMIFISFAGFTQIDRFDREFIMNNREAFSSMPLLNKIIFILLMVEFFKFRYFMVWHICQGSGWLAGFGYDPKKKDWSAVTQIDFWAFELATSPYLLSIHWNIGVHKWVKKYVYLRNKKKGSRPGTKEVFQTFLVIAFWHGFYPGYYIFFVLAGVGVEFGRIFRLMFRKRFIPDDYTFDVYKPIQSLKKINVTIALYNIAAYLATHAGTNYIAASFVLLSIDHSVFIWKETYGGPIFCGIVLYFTLKMFYGNVTSSSEKAKKQQ